MPPRPDFIAHWSALEDPEPQRYPNDTEDQGLDAAIGRKLGLTALWVYLLIALAMVIVKVVLIAMH